jgi:hypothetical protein
VASGAQYSGRLTDPGREASGLPGGRSWTEWTGNAGAGGAPTAGGSNGMIYVSW